MIKISPDFNYSEIYLTLRCNKNCSYCINQYTGINRDRKELNGNEWIESINNIDFGELPLTFGGGEPTLHKDFYEIVNNIRKDIKIDLLTNLTFNPNEFAYKISPEQFLRNNKAYKSIRVSYHPSNTDPNELIKKAVILQDSGFPIGIFGLNHPNNISANIEMSELARQNKIYFFIKDYLGEYNNQICGVYKYPDAINGKLKNCYCRTQEILIGPDGNIYQCHKFLYENIENLGNIQYVGFYHKFRKCNYFGSCNLCDIKLKTNRFLDFGSCSVEIKDDN